MTVYIKAKDVTCDAIAATLWSAVRREFELPSRWQAAIFTGRVNVYCPNDQALAVREKVEALVREL